MRSLTELFEYLKNSNEKTISKEMDEISVQLVKEYGLEADLYYKGHITKLNNLVSFVGHHFNRRFPNIYRNEVEKKPDDDLLKVGEVAKILKTTPQTIYNMIKKGKIEVVRFGTIDKPDASGNIRIRKSELKNISK